MIFKRKYYFCFYVEISTPKMKKKAVLIILFVIPIVVYLFFASGVYNFARLPVLTQLVYFPQDAKSLQGDSVVLNQKITVLGFLGEVSDLDKVGLFNVNEKIGKRFAEFTDFQFVYVFREGNEHRVEHLKNELSRYNNFSKWQFVSLSSDKILLIFNSLNSPFDVSQQGYSPYVFIVDKEGRLRGRTDDEDFGRLYGYNSVSVADLSNKMVDDVKVILAEYRLALKKYNKSIERKSFIKQ
ncbi:hypothetical protein DKB58_00470 [Capnocytophaga canimorsus]|nr:hypothetical protein DKB58_00470 [Capnocytophaga canimorsus]AYW36102.1 hypothetical protein D8L92_01325 [Capnocytophaga canimorsus]